MSGYTDSDFMKKVFEEVQEYKDSLMPMKASFWEQAFIKKLPPQKLHANPDDEFSMPEIGPNYSIINKYMSEFTKDGGNWTPKYNGEPLIVEKKYPIEYMLLNGHHRWAAAMQLGVKKVPVKLVNMTSKPDLERMLEKSRHDKRAVFDLDEVVLCTDPSTPAEKKLRFPFSLIYKERIRAGIPSLFYALDEAGYDVWVYSSGMFSHEYIYYMLKRNHVKVCGIVTRSRVKGKAREALNAAFQELFSKKYKESLHIDRSSIVRSFTGSKEFDQITLEASEDAWARNVIDAAKSFC